MNFRRKKFFLVLLTIASAAALSFKEASMMISQSVCYVTGPKVSIYNPNLYRTPGLVTPRPLPENLYSDVEIHVDNRMIPFYQVGQYLYGEAVELTNFSRNPSSIKGDLGLSGTIVPESSRFLSLVYANPRLRNLKRAIVCQLTAQTYNADGSDFLIIPMASQLSIKEKDEDFFEFFDHKSEQFKLIRKSDVVIQQELSELNKTQLRKTIVAQAEKLLGQPYQWGGQSALEGSGFDCSGLVKIVYQSCGKDIKRCVTQQFETSREINPSELQPGDLIFLYTQGPRQKNAVHVILYAGNNEIIEACPTEKKVKKTTVPVQGFTNGSPITVGTKTYLISFRSILNK